MGPDYERGDEVRLLFRIGTPLGQIGSWCLLVAALAVAVDAIRRRRWSGVPALVTVAGAWLVHTDHIFAPGGVVGMALLGAGCGWVAFVAPPGKTLVLRRNLGEPHSV